MSEIITCRSVRKIYWPNIALDDVSFSLSETGVHLLVGPNGSGKSTLLSILAGAERPTSGYVRVLGLDPWRDSERLASRVRALLDRTNLPLWLPCINVVEVASRISRTPWPKVSELAETLGVNSYWERPYGTYSTGMRRKCLLLLAFIGDVELILLDEPFQGLDPNSREVVVRLMEEKARGGTTLIVATHVVTERLTQLAKTTIRMELGRIVEIKR